MTHVKVSITEINSAWTILEIGGSVYYNSVGVLMYNYQLHVTHYTSTRPGVLNSSRFQYQAYLHVFMCM